MSNKRNIDDLFREELGGYTEAPPPAAWEALDKKLGTIPPRNSRYRYRYAGYLAALLLIAFVTIPGLMNSSSTGSVNDIIAGNTNAPAQESAPVAATLNHETTATTNEEAAVPGENKAPQYEASHTSPDNEPIPAVHGNGKHRVAVRQNVNTQDINHSTNPDVAINTSSKNSVNGPKSDDNEEDEAVSARSIKSVKAVNSSAMKPETANPKKEALTAQITAQEEEKIQQAHRKPSFNRIEFGVKLGYEKGFNNDAATKGVFTPYIQYNITKKLSVLVQPGVKYAKVSSRHIGNAQSYYKVNNDGTTKLADSTPAYIPTGAYSFDTFWFRTYNYSQTHDSIVKTNVFGGTYVEVELPILVKYRVGKKLAVYGGPNAAYGRVANVTEHTETTANIGQTGTAGTLANIHAPAPPPSALSNVIKYTGNPISNYSGPQYPLTAGSTLRFGYVVGFSYQVNKQLMFDALVQQGSAKQNVLSGYDINSALSAPYFRLSVGYKIK